MHVTHHRGVVDPILRSRLWDLYEMSVTPTAEQAASQELWLKSEFDEVVSDDTTRVWLLHKDTEIVALLLIATEFFPGCYLSRPYFERRYPEQMDGRRVHLIRCLAVHPRFIASGAISRLAKASLALEIEENAVLIFDAPLMHQPEAVGGFAEMMNRLAKLVGSQAEVEQIEVQRYYAIDFARVAAPAEPVGALAQTG
jgi:hypothetical protein